MRCGAFFFYTLFFSLKLVFTYENCELDGVCRREDEGRDVCDVYRQDSGTPIPSYTVSRTCGKDGPIVTEDTTFFKLLAAFVRERIPRRVALSKGAGAHGYFEVTHDITNYTKAAVFSQVGKKTPVFCRFSAPGGSDTSRGIHGFACKFYTNDGNWDLLAVGGAPVLNVRDPFVFMLAALSGVNPVTGRRDANTTWDFNTKRQETLNGNSFVYSDAGTPYGYRHMDGHSNNAYVFVNRRNKPIYVKFNWKTLQGVRNFTAEEAAQKAGENLDWSTKDLYDSIDAGNYPRWTLCVQLMTFELARHVNFDPLDPTAPWFEDEIPCRPVGKLTLNKNPKDYFSEVEQSGFSPSNLVSGIEPSQDRTLQARLFMYDDAQRYRLGVNLHQLPINRPHGVARCPLNLNRDGFMNYYNQDGEPNYYPNTYSHVHTNEKADFRTYRTDGIVGRHDLGNRANFEQARAIYGRFSKRDQDHLAKNIANAIRDAIKSIQCRVVQLMEDVSEKFAVSIQRHANIRCPRKYN